MKKFAEVFWVPYPNRDTVHEQGSRILFSKPKSYFPMLLEARKGMPYIGCPAIAEESKNDFVICAPYDLKLSFDKEKKNVSTDRYGQYFIENSVISHWHTSPQGMPPLIHIPPRYIMYSFDDVRAEITDLPIITSTFSNNVKIIRGSFNISKWYRAIEVAFEVIDTSKPVIVEAEQPMCMVRFHTPDDIPVKLTRVELTPELLQRVAACVAVKERRSGLKLSKLYELASDYIQLFKKITKCNKY